MPPGAWDCCGLKPGVPLQKKEHMRTNIYQSIENLKSFHDFNKLSITEKKELLSAEGIFLDLESEDDLVTRLYFLNGFFVEEVFSRSKNEIVELIPYKKGFKIESYLKNDSSLNERPYYFQYCIN